MDNNNLIDDQSLNIDFHEEVKAKNKTYTFWVFISMLIIPVLYPMSMIDGNQSILGRFVDSFIYTVVVTPFLAVLLGIPIALLPYKGLFLHQKYKRAFLLVLLCLNTALILILSFIGLYTLYDYTIN
ncbi:hypothetical protein [Aureispira sp. CCB-E]|uniref:hypothetical protein n=1 Tax=Aureispira sp. CCB-E TaxID=3051121 RepID=UPI0028694A6C|nr:hypothetical protein [Aureispira sp. CCB-E]WMX16129.1 hypothetical protein QP953_07095 [Aureispira sp. CCB-E]